MGAADNEGAFAPRPTMADAYEDMERELNALARRQGGISIPRNPYFSRRDVVAAFASAFEMIGGIPRLALWAHDNPSEFYKLYGKLLPSATQTEIIPAGRAPGSAPLRTYSTEELEAMLAESFEVVSVEGATIIPFVAPPGAGPESDDE